MRRNVPPANPGIAVSEKSCMVSNLNPIFGRRTATALITNHVANENMSENVVIHKVMLACLLPSDFQKLLSSGVHFVSHVAIGFIFYFKLLFLFYKTADNLLPYLRICIR